MAFGFFISLYGSLRTSEGKNVGFYLKKSVNFGGLRFNFSKSGVGISAGFKGFRLGTGPKGNYIHMGRGGLYYRVALGRKRATPNNQHACQTQQLPPKRINGSLHFQEIESAATELLTDTTSQEIINAINTNLKKWPFWPLCLLLAVGGTAGYIVGAFVATLICFLIDRNRKKTIIVYDIDEEIEKNIQMFYDAFIELAKCSMVWHVSEQADSRKVKKYHAGASCIVKITPIKIKYGAPSFIKTNVCVPNLSVGKQMLYFFPDKLFICEKNSVAVMGYETLVINAENQQFIEAHNRPEDGTVVGKTWLYLNKNGSPDRRFKDNRQIPIYSYSKINFSSSTGLNEEIQASKQNVGIALRAAFTAYRQGSVLTIETPKQ